MTLGYPPTERRGSIAADYGSPGPVYFLPPMTGESKHDPRSQFYRAPSFAFGRKHMKTPDQSPGPVYKPHPHLTSYGQKSMPAFSMYQRHKLPAAYNTPGVGTYAPESAGPSAKKRAPIYSLSKRLSDSTENIPAPNRYKVEDHMIGKTVRGDKPSLPIYSMGARFKKGAFYEDFAHTPGPAKADPTDTSAYKPRAPHYTMLGRNWMPGDVHPMPGPNNFRREKVKVDLRNAPSYSFGTRHSQHVLSPRIKMPRGSESLNMLAHMEWTPPVLPLTAPAE